MTFINNARILKFGLAGNGEEMGTANIFTGHKGTRAL